MYKLAHVFHAYNVLNVIFAVCHLPLTWPMVYTTDCTTVQAVIHTYCTHIAASSTLIDVTK